MMRLVDALPPEVAAPHGLDLDSGADLRIDSRQIRPGDIFVALPGERSHGIQWVPQAVDAGAGAILTDRPVEASVPVIVVERLAEQLFAIACTYYGVDLHQVEIHAVTGTNGKTSVTWMLREAARKLGRRAAVVGTIVRDGPGYREPSGQTTPHFVDVLRLLSRWGTDQPLLLAIEASSHALEQSRLGRLPVDVAVLTTLGRDHLDYHGTMEDYVAAKARLFRQPCGATACRAVMPAALRGAVDAHDRPLLTFGRTRDADAVIDSDIDADGGTRVRVRVDGHQCGWRLAVPGHWQADNSVAAFLSLVSVGVEPLQAAGALDGWNGVPGRMQLVATEPFRVFVDYAHTPDALQAALEAARALVVGGRLSVVFGCGGERDQGKRAQMGAIAAKFADHIIVTSDNPRSEPPEAIVADILEGIEADRSVDVVLDRAEAIRRASAACRPGDVLLIAGKGHETEQRIGTAVRPFSDVEEVRRWLR